MPQGRESERESERGTGDTGGGRSDDLQSSLCKFSLIPLRVGSHLAKAQLGGVGLAAFTRLPSTVGERATWGLSTSVSWDLVLDQSVGAGGMRHAACGELPKLSFALSLLLAASSQSHSEGMTLGKPLSLG